MSSIPCLAKLCPPLLPPVCCLYAIQLQLQLCQARAAAADAVMRAAIHRSPPSLEVRSTFVPSKHLWVHHMPWACSHLACAPALTIYHVPLP